MGFEKGGGGGDEIVQEECRNAETLRNKIQLHAAGKRGKKKETD